MPAQAVLRAQDSLHALGGRWKLALPYELVRLDPAKGGKKKTPGTRSVTPSARVNLSSMLSCPGSALVISTMLALLASAGSRCSGSRSRHSPAPPLRLLGSGRVAIYFWPFSTQLWAWDEQWDLASWQNTVIGLGATLGCWRALPSAGQRWSCSR